MGFGTWSLGFCTNLPPATVSFLDGSFLRGEIQALDADTLKWRHPNARAPIEFSTTNLNQIRFPARVLDLPTNAAPVCRIVLTSGDEFEGRLLSLDADSFEVETWFAGRLRGRRAGLQSLAFYGSSQTALYDGPRTAEEWTISTGAANGNRVGVDILGGRNIIFGGGLQVAPPPAAAPVAPAEPKRPILPVVPRAALLDAGGNPIAQAPKAEVERAVGKTPPVIPPVLPPKPSSGAAADRIAKVKPASSDITRMSTAARFSATITDYLKSDLVQLALETGLVKADAVKTELDKQVAEGVPVQSLVGREGALLTARLLRELEHLKQDSSATALAHAYFILARISGGVAADQAVSVPSHAAALVINSVTAAQRAATAEQFTKSELVRAAADSGMASERALERWFEDYTNAAELERDKSKADRFRALVKAEAALLGTRLLRTLGAGVGVAEAESLERLLAQAQTELARGALAAAQAEVLAQARVRAMEALKVNNPNFAAIFGAEAALAGRAAAAGTSTTNAAWQFRDGAYFATAVGTLGRECHLPTKARIEFDLAWKGQPFFRFSFFTRNPDTYDYSDGWQFYTSSSGYIYSMRRSGMGASSSSGARVPQMLAKNTVRFTFLVNTEKETVILLADGERVHEWKNLGSPGPGTAIVFYNYNASSRVRVSDIRISPWDGRERDAAAPGAPGDDPEKLVEVPPADSAVVEFVNQDRATGTLHGIRDGKLAFDPAGVRLDIPVARAALITFPVANAPALPKVDGVQVTLHRNERLTLALEQWAAGEILALSPVFGRLKLKPEAVRVLRFNPSAPRGVTDEWNGP